MKILKTLLGITLLALVINYSCAALSKELVSQDEKELGDLIAKVLEPYKTPLQKWFWELSGMAYNNPFTNAPETRADYITCDICNLALPYIRDFLKVGVSNKTIIAAITLACQVLDLAPMPEICLPTIESYALPMLYIVEHKPDMPDGDFCGIINPGCVEISDYLKTWKIRMNNQKPPATIRPNPPPATTPLTEILQFTDIHLDLDYEAGTNSDCGLPICCRLPNGPPKNQTYSAGRYGHFGCALPETALKAIYKDAATRYPNASFVFLTGDFIHSGVWLYGVEENTRHIESVTTLLKEAFQDNEHVEIYPLTGNHETDVVNMYPSESAWNDFPLAWMYTAVAEPFKDIFPKDQYALFIKYGYYTIMSKHDTNLRIVALNTNICYINNFWLPFDAIDTYGQLQWFVDVMNTAEILKQKVFIIGHIHPGSGSCWPEWSNEFNRVINRYEAIIRGQWYGHSHEQDYKLSFEEETGRPISVSYVGGSGVTDGMNSAYNVYYADGKREGESTWEIINHETFILNLTRCNNDPPPFPELEEVCFQKILNAQKDFGLKSLVPEEIYDFINRMVCDNELFNAYQKVVVKGADSPRFNPCYNDTDCKAGILGDLFVSNSADRSYREKLEEHIRTVDCTEVKDNGANTLKWTSLLMIIATALLFFRKSTL